MDNPAYTEVSGVDIAGSVVAVQTWLVLRDGTVVALGSQQPGVEHEVTLRRMAAYANIKADGLAAVREARELADADADAAARAVDANLAARGNAGSL